MRGATSGDFRRGCDPPGIVDFSGWIPGGVARASLDAGYLGCHPCGEEECAMQPAKRFR